MLQPQEDEQLNVVNTSTLLTSRHVSENGLVGPQPEPSETGADRLGSPAPSKPLSL